MSTIRYNEWSQVRKEQNDFQFIQIIYMVKCSQKTQKTKLVTCYITYKHYDAYYILQQNNNNFKAD